MQVIMTLKVKVASPFIMWFYSYFQALQNVLRMSLLRRVELLCLRTVVQFSHARHHDAGADEQKAHEDVEPTSREERRHNGDAEDAGIGVVFPYLTDHFGHHLSSTFDRPRGTHTPSVA